MRKVIQIKDLSFGYEDKKIFNNLNINIEKGKWVTIVGSNASGKSTLINLIAGIYKFTGKIIINEKEYVNAIEFKFDKVRDEINYYLKKYNLINTKVIDNLGIKKLFCLNVNELEKDKKIYLKFIICLIKNPQVLLIDNCLEILTHKDKEKIIGLLKKSQKKGMTIINSTVNIEDSLIGNDIILLDKGNILLNGSVEEVLTHEKTFKECKLELPFIVSLSLKLKYYGVVDKIYFDMGELIDAIW